MNTSYWLVPCDIKWSSLSEIEASCRRILWPESKSGHFSLYVDFTLKPTPTQSNLNVQAFSETHDSIVCHIYPVSSRNACKRG